MRLRREEIDIVARKIVEELQVRGKAELEQPEETVAVITRIISDDLQVEDRLNDDVRQILSEHLHKMQREGVEYHRMFNMIKAKLIKDRKLVL